MELKSTVIAACEVMQMQANSKNIKIELNLPHTKINMVSDKQRLVQIIINLLSNAIKFSEDSVLKVKAWSSQNDENGKDTDHNYIYVSIQDFGIGISEID